VKLPNIKRAISKEKVPLRIRLFGGGFLVSIAYLSFFLIYCFAANFVFTAIMLLVCLFITAIGTGPSRKRYSYVSGRYWTEKEVPFEVGATIGGGLFLFLISANFKEYWYIFLLASIISVFIIYRWFTSKDD
jgi:hypothetical protein